MTNTPEVQARITQRECLGCDRHIGKRERYKSGLCEACYQKVNRWIRTCEIAESTLIADGKLSADKSLGGRPKEKTALDEYRAKLKAKE